MPAHLVLTLDTAPPANPLLAIEGGALVTANQVVVLALSTPSADVAEMKIWGDLDPTADPLFQVAEVDSMWVTFDPEPMVRLSAGSGTKTLYAKLRDDVANETPAVTDAITLDLDTIAVSISTPPDRTRVSEVSPYDRSTFSWQATKAFDQYEVRVVLTTGSPRTSGVLVPTAAGSVNVAGAGSFLADTPITTVLDGTDLRAASPGDSPKIVKVFAHAVGGAWSA